MKPTMQIFNPNKNIIIPEWLNAEYFKNILTKDEPDLIKIENFTPIAAIPPGGNFTSVMLRIHMDLLLRDETIKHKTYVLKTVLDDDKGGDFIHKLELFPKEMEMYSTYLPAFENLCASAGWNIQLAPKCLFTEKRDGHINFVFEDLSERNFQNIDRLKGFDMLHMKSILQRLAEFHAASAVYEEHNGDYPKKFQSGFFDPKFGTEFLRKAFESKIISFKKAMSFWDLKDKEKYMEKLPNFDQYWKCGQSTLQQKTNNFNVLNHGDFWSSNIMLFYLPNGTLKELIFLDFQICKWGSPAEDLLFFITLSAAKDIRVKEFDHFVSIYHERLVECLQVLSFKKSLPKLRDLQKDMFDLKNTFYAFFGCFNHLPAVLLPTDKDSNIHSFAREDEIGETFRMKAYTNPLLVETMKDLLPFYHTRGLFNFTDYDDC